MNGRDREAAWLRASIDDRAAAYASALAADAAI
jgi:hypothetical protein